MDRELRDVAIRLASLGNRQTVARKGEKGEVREDSVLGSRWLDRWQHHSLKLETCRSERRGC